MSANKYADLPDIDTAPDIYETDDVVPIHAHEESSDEDATLATRPRGRNTAGAQPPTQEELDSSHLIASDEAAKKFRRAERKRASTRPQFEYPRSPSPSEGKTRQAKPATISNRLKALKAELISLETELSDPSNEQVHKEWKEDNVDPGELIRDLVQVRARLQQFSKGKEGRGRLVGLVMGDEEKKTDRETKFFSNGSFDTHPESSTKNDSTDRGNLIEMDRRVAELEKLVGSSTATLDETSPLPPPLLPQITRLTAQVTLLTQPRHIDSISRRLKLLLSDLERVTAAQNASSTAASANRHGHGHTSSVSSTPFLPASNIPDELMPILTRLSPLLPQIPHILTRLKTLSALHTSAAAFSTTLSSLEDEQKQTHQALLDLQNAVNTVEKSLEENKSVVKGNVSGLEGRVEKLLRRLEELDK